MIQTIVVERDDVLVDDVENNGVIEAFEGVDTTTADSF